VSVNGLALPTSPYAAGDDLTILVSSGDVVAMASDSANITVTSTLNGLTESSVTKTSTAYTVSLTNSTGSGPDRHLHHRLGLGPHRQGDPAHHRARP
jgi:hypothetical protein